MRRHAWKATDSQRGFDGIERCPHCDTERVNTPNTKTLYEYRGGRARGPFKAQLPQDGTWAAFMSGVIPQCVERP